MACVRARLVAFWSRRNSPKLSLDEAPVRFVVALVPWTLLTLPVLAFAVAVSRDAPSPLWSLPIGIGGPIVAGLPSPLTAPARADDRARGARWRHSP